MRLLANPFGLCLGLVLTACSGGHEPRIVDMAQLDAAVKQNLGRGTLVNVWATW